MTMRSPISRSCARVQAVPHRLGQRGTGIEEHLHAREQRLAQRVVGLHRVGNRLEAGGHVEVHRGRDLAQVAQRLVHQRGRGLAVVDVQRAAVEHAPCRSCGCRRRCGSRAASPPAPAGSRPAPASTAHHLLLVGAPHALRVDHGLGHLGRAAGEQELDDGVRAGGGHGGVDRWRRLGGQQVGERGGGAAGHGALGGHHFHVRHPAWRAWPAVALRVAGKHQARRQRLHARGAACRSPGSPASRRARWGNRRCRRRGSPVPAARVRGRSRSGSAPGARRAGRGSTGPGRCGARHRGLREGDVAPVAGAAVGVLAAARKHGLVGARFSPSAPAGRSCARGRPAGLWSARR